VTSAPASTQRTHQRAVRFFWALLIAATTVSLIGNVAHAMLPYLPRVLIQISAAAVPPIALLAAVHGIALAVRAGASGAVYRCAVGAVGVIGMGAFAVSFLALRDLMREIGYSTETAWIFPAIIDTAVAVSTLMLDALGDKPARRARSASVSNSARTSAPPRSINRPAPDTKGQVTRAERSTTMHAAQPDGVSSRAGSEWPPLQGSQESAHTDATQIDTELALKLLAAGATTQSVETVTAVLSATRGGASINAAAKTAGINYRTAQRIAVAAAEHEQRALAVVS
jgi:Protein of unknown function (DUF2637)